IDLDHGHPVVVSGFQVIGLRLQRALERIERVGCRRLAGGVSCDHRGTDERGRAQRVFHREVPRGVKGAGVAAPSVIETMRSAGSGSNVGRAPDGQRISPTSIVVACPSPTWTREVPWLAKPFPPSTNRSTVRPPAVTRTCAPTAPRFDFVPVRMNSAQW